MFEEALTFRVASTCFHALGFISCARFSRVFMSIFSGKHWKYKNISQTKHGRGGTLIGVRKMASEHARDDAVTSNQSTPRWAWLCACVDLRQDELGFALASICAKMSLALRLRRFVYSVYNYNLFISNQISWFVRASFQGYNNKHYKQIDASAKPQSQTHLGVVWFDVTASSRACSDAILRTAIRAPPRPSFVCDTFSLSESLNVYFEKRLSSGFALYFATSVILRSCGSRPLMSHLIMKILMSIFSIRSSWIYHQTNWPDSPDENQSKLDHVRAILIIIILDV